MFSGCPSPSACAHPYALLTRYLTNQQMEFHETSVVDVVELIDELTRF